MSQKQLINAICRKAVKSSHDYTIVRPAEMPLWMQNEIIASTPKHLMSSVMYGSLEEYIND